MLPLSSDYIFMSYSRRDDAVMRRIVAFLREQGIKVWVDNEKLIPGTPVWEKEIEKAVQGASAVVVVLSPDSKDSEWVRREISLADQYEKRVFPLLVRGDEKTSISIRLIGRQYVDIRSNEDAGLNYVSATLLRYLEELNEREQSAKKEADRLAAQKIKTEKRLAARKAEEERIALEKVVADRKAKEDADRLSAQKAEGERIANEKLEADRKAKEDIDRLAAQKMEEERIALEKVAADRKAKEEADRLSAQKAEEERIALEKIAADRKAKEDADRLAAQKAELESKEKMAREKLQREQMERDAEKEVALQKTEREAAQKVETKKIAGNSRFLALGGFGLIILVGLFVAGAFIISRLQSASSTPAAPTAGPYPTEAPLGIGSTMIGNDGMTLLYVPAGEFLMGSTDADPNAQSNEKPRHPVTLDAYWIDQTDVTNAMYSKCVSAGKCTPPNDTTHYSNSNYATHPVVYVSWNDAIAYCSWAGRRLPTEAEWEKAARGTDGRIYPWGNQSPDASLLNYNSNIGDTTEVGKYPNGKSVYGAYDMVGNVWQWVNDWYSDTYYQSSPSTNPLGPDTGQSRVLRGVSLQQYINNFTRSAYRNAGSPVVTAYDIGFRCASSEANATNQAPTVTVAPIATQVPALGIGSTMTGNDGMILLYVPAGEFLMGSTDADTLAKNEEKPQHPVTLDVYWIDQMEVTNAQYAKCVADNGACKEPTNRSSYTHSSYYGNSEFDHYPVLYVDWNMANAYCSWVDRRLPTEAEWEKAARGENGNIYPWGNEWDVRSTKRLNFSDKNDSTGASDTVADDGYADVSPVGNYPSGQSAYGAYDMAGNVWEWVNDWYDVYPGGDPAASADFGQKYRVLRGGSWYNNDINVRSADRYRNDPTYIVSNIGFRCARSP